MGGGTPPHSHWPPAAPCITLSGVRNGDPVTGPHPPPASDGGHQVAFVLGGGGLVGAAEVGMLRALAEAGVVPDVVVGTSVGAMNGALVAADPAGAADRLTELWQQVEIDNPFVGSVLDRVRRLARSGTHLHGNEHLRALLDAVLPVATFEQLPVPFQCVASSIERAAARWFSSGPLVDAVLASSAIPGVLPPVEIDGEHHLDGGLVDSIPLGRAVQLGARTVYVLQVGRIEQPLTVPETPWDVGMVAFEIARRSRFIETLDRLPEHVDVHVLPTGASEPLRYNDPRQLRYRDMTRLRGRIDAAYEASAAYLAEPVGRWS